ncbi:Dna2/Cas4 domain-containing protein [Belliella aquatica]|uniref:DUF83 domain-containing protein n=1 Tax=Belliella aquatica TaxID=1323734 RepID=A0ABQ1N3K9_9BACT|nr:Dna2/Cas4 domain-containing protein [Belliella aquatica]MCH7407110.1 CRISPR-associated protein Cas4 [Belliella aquatica]GGC52088.1 hypothetical protein GCM10010993_33210 [Belliella aquatica]
MEYTSQIVAEGKLIAETTYLDSARKYTELELDGIKIDFYDVKNKVIHEVKKSYKVKKRSAICWEETKKEAQKYLSK